MARGVLGMTPKLGKRKTEVMRTALHCPKYAQNTMFLLSKHHLPHLPTTPELPLLLLQGGNTVQMSTQSRRRHGKLTQGGFADKFTPFPRDQRLGTLPFPTWHWSVC